MVPPPNTRRPASPPKPGQPIPVLARPERPAQSRCGDAEVHEWLERFCRLRAAGRTRLEGVVHRFQDRIIHEVHDTPDLSWRDRQPRRCLGCRRQISIPALLDRSLENNSNSHYLPRLQKGGDKRQKRPRSLAASCTAGLSGSLSFNLRFSLCRTDYRSASSHRNELRPVPIVSGRDAPFQTEGQFCSI